MSKRELKALQETPIFKHDIYMFNGHGQERVENGQFVMYTLPENVYYVTTTECGKVSQLASVDVLKAFSYRNPSLDKTPIPKTEEYNFNKKELAEIFGVENPDTIHIHLPGTPIKDNLFLPVSTIGDPTTTSGFAKVRLDGAPGLIKRDDILLLSRDTLTKLTSRTLIGNMSADDFVKFYGISKYPTKQEVQAKLAEEADPKKKVRETVRYFYANGKPVSELINKFKSNNRKTIFFNPLCRVLPANSGIPVVDVALAKAASSEAEQGRKGPEQGRKGPEGGRRKTRRHKKLKRQTRKRR